MTRLFLDTTIQIEKIFGRDRYEISKYLKENDVLTSSYVLMEFKRTILKDCIALHSYLKEEGDLESTFIRLSELRVHEHRIASRISKILSGMCGQDSIEYEKVCDSLKEVLEDPEKARGRKNCWRLGDCIISIESPKTHTILTTDHHYGIICNSLEKPVLSLQQIVTTPHPTQARLQA